MEYYQGSKGDDLNKVIIPIWNSIRASINAIYANDASYTVKPWCATNLEYTGLWGDKSIHSISMQTAKKGIPGLQIETMLDVRNQLNNDQSIQKKWAEAFIKLYNDIVKPQWNTRSTKVTFNAEYAAKVHDELTGKVNAPAPP